MFFKRFKKMLVLLMMSSFIVNHTIPVYATQQVVVSNGTVKINNVPKIKQFPELPTGCEATALTMLLRYYGVNVTKQDVANRIPRVSLPHYKNKIRYGGDPNKGFVGNPYLTSSYGVFEKPILKVLNGYLPNRAEDLTGKTLGQLLEYVKDGRPVMIWATIDMQNIVYRQSWKLSTGEVFRWPGKEHAVVITGYDSKYIYLNDPYTGTEKKYKREVVENRYNALGKKAVAISKTFKEMPVKIVSNGITSDEALNYKAIQKEDKILLPVKCLSSIDSRIALSYKNNKVYLTIQGQQLELDRKYNEVKISLEENKIVTLYYEIKDGVTQIDLKTLKQVLPMAYDIQDNQLIIKIDKAVDMLINGKPIAVEKEKEILMKDNKIWLPITYIRHLTESFRYEYKDKQIYMYLDERTYALKNNVGNVDLILEDGTTVKLYYEIEKGVTRIEFNGLAQYMKLNYTSQDTTLFIHIEGTNDETNSTSIS